MNEQEFLVALRDAKKAQADANAATSAVMATFEAALKGTYEKVSVVFFGEQIDIFVDDSNALYVSVGDVGISVQGDGLDAPVPFPDVASALSAILAAQAAVKRTLKRARTAAFKRGL